jgi:hypothetical protein
MPRSAPPESGCLTDRDRERLLLAQEIRRAIDSSGLTLRAVEKRLAAYGSALSSSLATLSDWQCGAASPPSTEKGLNRVLALERCLDVPAGDLAVLIPGRVRPTPPRPESRRRWRERADRATLAQRHRQFKAIVDKRTGSQLTIPATIEKTYALGYDLQPAQTISRISLRAAHDGVDRTWFVHAPGALLHPSVLPVSGCRLGAVVHEEEVMVLGEAGKQSPYRLSAVELLFDRTLRRGEPYPFAFALAYPAEGSHETGEPLFRHIQRQPCQRLDLTLAFQETQPGLVRELRWGLDLRGTGRPVEVRDPTGTYRQRIDDPVPGAYGWDWERAAAINDQAA